MRKDFFSIALSNLRYRKLRTWLTVLGIVIGIAAIVTLISVSSGLENSINDQFEKMGANRIFVYAKGVFSNIAGGGITDRDVRTLERVSEIEWTSPYLYGSREAEYGRKKSFVQNLFGMVVDEDIRDKFESFDVYAIKGRLFKKGETGVAVFGYMAAKELFGKDVSVGEKISFSGSDFKIIGVLSEIGNPEDDFNVYIPMDDARELFNEPDKITMIDIKLKDGVDINFAAGKIKKELERARGDENFEVVTPEQLLKQFGSILDILSVVLGGIAAISIVVGGVGIMNSTYTSVLERTKEIGIMKSIGAKNNDIFSLVLIESGFIGVVGGLVGVLVGVLLSVGVSGVLKEVGFGMVKISLDWRLMLFCLIFGVGIGVLSGYFPARKASKLKPAEAMRY
ncbi:MAG: ABC transporter permease [Nanoarchaeota archaeon]|nr:ABC transporter permease [Nanoarchaeota archaeon]